MKRIYRLFSFILVVAFLLITIPICLQKLSSNAEEKKNSMQMITSTPFNGEKIPLIGGVAYEVMRNYSVKASEGKYTGENAYYPKTVEIAWNCAETPSYYTLKIGNKKDLSDATSFITFDSCVNLNNLLVAKKYYYKIFAHYQDKTIISKTFEFETENLPRTINVAGVSNTRDIGGYFTADKEYQVKQGMVYRGEQLEGITDEGKHSFLVTYGIKTDLDLRANNGSSPLGDAVNYIGVKGPYYVNDDHGVNAENEEYRQGLLTEIKAFANENNYPIYIHCAIGRDRTGTLAFLLNALLGVGETDLYKDYEMSFFSESGTRDNAKPTDMVNGITNLINHMKTYNMPTLKQNVEKFMLELGVSQSEIDAIRSIMLEEV